MPELLFRPAQARRGAAEAQKIGIAHLAQSGAHCFKLDWLESDRTQVLSSGSSNQRSKRIKRRTNTD
jgi:hypothetical protein